MSQARLIDLCPKCQLNSPVWGGIVSSFTPNMEENSVEIALQLKELATPETVQEAAQGLEQVYGLKKVNITPTYIDISFNDRDLECITAFICGEFPSLKGAVRHIARKEHHLLIETPWLFRLESIKTELESKLTKWIGTSILVELAECQSEKTYEELRNEQIKRIEEQIVEEQRCAPPPQQNNNFGQKKDNGTPPWKKKRDPNAQVFKADAADDNIIYGRPQTREITKIEDTIPDGSRIMVKGQIFFKEFRTLNGRGKTVCTFDLYDGTGSIRVVKLFPDDEVDEVKAAMKKADAVAVQGTVSYSEFEKDKIISPTAIIKDKIVGRQDTAPQKRVELHLHTNMSAMDGFCDTGKVVGLAASFGHRAVAITDHGVAQAYPDAMNAAGGLKEKYPDFKVLYGIEAYGINDLDGVAAVKGFTTAALDDEIVVFDFETTGLSAKTCEIIEIAAVILKNGQEIAEYQSYIKPKESIPGEITQLTGISNATVANARAMQEVVPEFLEFIGQRPLVAHNADFDVGFLQQACLQLGIERQFCSADTVTMAKLLLPNLKRHRLNTIAEFYGLNFNHHRALDDTKVLAQIVLRFWEIYKETYGITLLSQVNGVLDGLSKKQGSGSTKNSFHMVILVKNKTGLRNLYEMISHSHLKYFKRHPLMPLTMVKSMREGLIIGSACEAGELYSAVVRGATWNELVKIASFYDYLEIQPVANNAFMLEKGMVKNEEQIRDFNRTIVKLGDHLKKPVVATGDVHFIEPEDCHFREILMTGMGFSDADKQAPLYFKTTQEMLDEFSYLGPDKAFEVVVTNTNLIADSCENIRPIPKEQYPPKIDHSAEDIENMSRNKVREIYGENPPKEVSDRLEVELNSIIGHGFDVMYLIAQKLVSKSVENGYLVGSRGSVGSSFVAFLTGITEVNALPPHYVCPNCKHSIFDVPKEYACGVDMPDKACPNCGTNLKKDGFDIAFATFLGFDGDKTPDIDLNFSGEYQARAHKDTIELFGEENVFRAGTIGTVKDKTAYGFVKKYLEQKGMVKNRAEENRLVQGCTGIKRTTGQHPGGLMVVPRGISVYDFTPVQRPADDTETDIITTHFDYHSIHDNLLKLDLLGHDDPTMIKVLEDLTGENAQKIPLDDKETMGIFTDISFLKDKDGNPLDKNDKLLGVTGAAAVPEFGTRFVRQMLVDTQPSAFEDLCRISGLSHGTNVWLNNAQDIIRSGQGTIKDVVCVRDDILKYLMSIGVDNKTAFTIMESVRKGKGLKPEWIETIETHKAYDWYVESCRKIEYLFPRAHAVAYVMMAYRIAWFKVHRPLAFYSAYFSIRAGAFDASVMTMGDDVVMRKVNELMNKDKRSGVEEDMLITLEVCHEFYKRGFTFHPVDVYKSHVSNFLIEGETLIAPLTSLPGVGAAAAEDIVRERVKEPFMSAEEIIMRCSKVGKAVIEALDSAGALGTIPKSNQISLF